MLWGALMDPGIGGVESRSPKVRSTQGPMFPVFPVVRQQGGVLSRVTGSLEVPISNVSMPAPHLVPCLIPEAELRSMMFDGWHLAQGDAGEGLGLSVSTAAFSRSQGSWAMAPGENRTSKDRGLHPTNQPQSRKDLPIGSREIVIRDSSFENIWPYASGGGWLVAPRLLPYPTKGKSPTLVGCGCPTFDLLKGLEASKWSPNCPCSSAGLQYRICCPIALLGLPFLHRRWA